MKVLYERDPSVGNGYGAYKGRIESSYRCTQVFSGYHFDLILRALHANMAEDDKELIFIRTDRPELDPYPLAEGLITLIKVDVERAIEAMRVPDVRICVRAPLPDPQLAACSDTLSSAFGEELSCAYRTEPGVIRIECPGCGRWSVASHTSTHCLECDLTVPYTLLDSLWARVRVPDLLATSAVRFFFPRKWNTSGVWISREDLQTRYAQYLASKDKYNE